jgi:hypothetical protein
VCSSDLVVAAATLADRRGSPERRTAAASGLGAGGPSDGASQRDGDDP